MNQIKNDFKNIIKLEHQAFWSISLCMLFSFKTQEKYRRLTWKSVNLCYFMDDLAIKNKVSSWCTLSQFFLKFRFNILFHCCFLIFWALLENLSDHILLCLDLLYCVQNDTWNYNVYLCLYVMKNTFEETIFY